jgi:UDPglucose 6-dehydrogenase
MDLSIQSTGSGRPVLSVIGLGKLGAPMAALFASKGFQVIGIDVVESFVSAINAGRAPVEETELQATIDAGCGRLRATLDWDEAVAGSDVSFIVVPTPSGPNRFFMNRDVINASERLGAGLRKKRSRHLVVVVSTVMPGSCNGEIRQALERASGRAVGGRDLGLCYNPAFVALGSVLRDMRRPDVVLIGESDEVSGALLERVHRAVVDNAPEFLRADFVNAEVAKIAVNTFVTTKISYANMISELCARLPGADAEVVMRAVGADGRIGNSYLKPATGYGGPCFSRDNQALTALGRELGVACELSEATERINERQVHRVVGAIEACLRPGDTIGILGLAYKPDTGVIEDSQGVALAALLAAAGHRVIAADPQAGAAAVSVLGGRVEVVPHVEDILARADVVAIMTPWPAFATLAWTSIPGPRRVRVAIDPWGVISRQAAGGPAVVRLRGPDHLPAADAAARGEDDARSAG